MAGRGDAMLAAGRALFRALPGLAPTFLIVALLACVLVPLPTALVDLLLTLSLSGAVLLLVASVSIRRTTEFLSFPSLLLLVTLFRLALNVSTTRLILSQAFAGDVIEAFAGFVVRGDLIVGGVMFLIITIVQYVVIARGAERVAEVAARFALDGLPGHQAAIDADLRAGVISATEAALRRARLAERSSFYGAMDGAVRFVKGDAIAGLAITAVNLLGGLAIGMTRMSYGWEQSLGVYGRLTIGDGLLAQIPALLVSLAAGVLVSRVDRQEDGRATARWLDPAMLVVPASMLLALAAVPAMPALAFITTATALLTAALALSARAASARRLRPAPIRERRITVCLADADVEDGRALERALAEVRQRCAGALGVDVPPVGLRTERAHPRGLVEVNLDERLRARAHVGPAPDVDAVVLATFRAVMEHAKTLVDLQDVDGSVERARATHPVVVRRALEVVELTDVLAIVRALLRERIPVPPMRMVLSTLAESRRFCDAAERPQWPEIARLRLAPYWMHEVLDALSRLGPPRWVRLDPEAEDELLDRVTVAEDGLMLSATSGERAQWHAQLLQVAEVAGDVADGNVPGIRRGPIVVLTTPKARRAAAELFSGMTPHVPVLSTAELQRAHAPAPQPVRWLAPP